MNTNFSKYLIFGTSLLCAFCFVNFSFATTIKSIETSQQDKNSLYEDFVEDTFAVAEESGLIDLSGIKLGMLEDNEYKNIYEAISNVLNMLDDNSSNRELNFTLLLNPFDIVRLNSAPKNSSTNDIRTQKVKKISELTKNYTGIVLPSDESLRKTKRNSAIHFMQLLDEAFETAQKTNVIDLKKVDIETLTDFELQILEAKISRFLKHKAFNEASVIEVYSSSLTTRTNGSIPDSMQKIADIASKYNTNSKYNIHIEFICDKEKTRIFQIEDAINTAYETNIIDLRFIADNELENSETTSLLANINAFAQDYDFNSFGKIIILMPDGSVEPEEKQYLTKLMNFVRAQENKFEIKIGDASNRYDLYIGNLIEIAKKTKILDLTALNYMNFSEEEEEDYNNALVNYATDNNMTLYVTASSDNGSRSKYSDSLAEGIHKPIKKTTLPNKKRTKHNTEPDKFSIRILPKVAIKVDQNTNNELIKKINTCCRLGKISLSGTITNELANFIKAKVELLKDRTSIKDFAIFGTFSDGNDKDLIGCETHNSSEELFGYTEEKINNSKTTSVIDFSDVDFRIFRMSALAEDIQGLEALIAEFLYKNFNRNIKFVIGIPKNHPKYDEYSQIAENVIKGLEELEKSFKNFQAKSITVDYVKPKATYVVSYR